MTAASPHCGDCTFLEEKGLWDEDQEEDLIDELGGPMRARVVARGSFVRLSCRGCCSVTVVVRRGGNWDRRGVRRAYQANREAGVAQPVAFDTMITDGFAQTYPPLASTLMSGFCRGDTLAGLWTR